ncbi:hypothetical protein BH20ACI4_BH20ACI4_18680 [soil metagenome]
MKILFSALLFCLLFCVSAFAQEAEKIDEFSNIPCDDYLARVDAAIYQAHNNPTSIVYVFIYEGKEYIYNWRKKKTEYVLPANGSAKAKIASMKEYFSTKKVLVKNIKFIEAGFRENSTVEFWLVPNGVEPPKPVPTLETMKYRKGKAKGFCIDCCGI